MMGYGSDRGIIPLTCSALFDVSGAYACNLLQGHADIYIIILSSHYPHALAH